MVVGLVLYSEDQIEQIWNCPGAGPCVEGGATWTPASVDKQNDR